ncbi:MAG TPA: hypothetical protein VJL81_03565 [Solirubrobacterales bacterium]|nr:hypothetical protein [Solirubrobacterales bacterium]
MAEENGKPTEETELTEAEVRARLYRRLDALKLPGPWTDADDLWLEFMTEEPQGRRRASRDPDL